MALTNAERQARYRARRQAGESRIRYRRPADRRSRPQQWYGRGADAPGAAGPVPGVAGRVAGTPRRVRDRGVAQGGLRSGPVGIGGCRAAQGLRAGRLDHPATAPVGGHEKGSRASAAGGR